MYLIKNGNVILIGQSVTSPSLLCGHGSNAVIQEKGNIARCPECGSFLDLTSVRTDFTYDESYPESRGHTSEIIGQLKIRSLRRWLDELKLDISSLRICEVGFGGGYPLAFMNEYALAVFGLEAIAENIEHAMYLGVAASHLFNVNHLPEKLPASIDLWVYQDSFEHIPVPKSHLEWVALNSAPNASVLLVLPEASSFSEKFLGRWWPHRIVDHTFHWSQKGLEHIWSQSGFEVVSRFHPSKCVSLGMLVVHTLHALGIKIPRNLATYGPVIWFNIGEQGLLLRRRG
jgi:hypothetical protein